MKHDFLDSKDFDEQLSGSPDGERVLTIEISEADADMELSDLWRPDEDTQQENRKEYEDELCKQGHVTAEQLEQARTIHRKTPRKRLGQILLEMGVVQEAELLACLAKQYDLPFIRVDREMVNTKALEILDRGFDRRLPGWRR